MKEKLIDAALLRRLSPLLAAPVIRQCVLKIAGLDIANRVYDSAKHLTGTDIEDAMIDGLGITRRIHNIEVLRQFPDGQPFITVSNHPYGHIDGVMLIGDVSKVRPDFKVMVNWALRQIDIMENHFIGVNPFSQQQFAFSNVGGVRECLHHLQAGHPLGFFPAGSISKNIGHGRAKDRPWQDGVVRLIQKADVPVVPVFISGQNSAFFNFLDHFPWWVRNIRLCHELDTKRGKTIHLVFGEPIRPSALQSFDDTASLATYLRDETYRLATAIGQS
jgi:putative hemolysin